MTSLNLTYLMKEVRELTGRIPKLTKNFEYVLTSDDLTAEEFDLTNKTLDKLYKIETILQSENKVAPPK
jgi:hypothetical protein